MPTKKAPAKPTKSPGAEPQAKPSKGKATKASPKVVPEPASPLPEAPPAVLPKKAPRKTAKAAPPPEPPASEPPAPPRPSKAPRPTAQGLEPRAQAILEALQEGRALEFIFEDGDTNPPRTFEPRMLSFDALTQAWYVWGWDRRYNAERHHRLDLLKEINGVEGVGRSAQGPYKEGTPANQIGGWLGGEPIPVKAVLLKQWIFAVRQAPPPFPEFRMEDMEEGKASVSFTATDLRAIARWCMQFGDGIQVLEPQRLVDRIKQVGVTWGGKAAQAAPPPPPRPAIQQAPPPPPPRHRETRESEEKGKPAAKGPRVEVRIERL
ncbi:MAG: WYL domain-containing protein [Acidobacteria bacterium]|nr:WYL domain-containing protein [Acidobacteriota bacterium]